MISHNLTSGLLSFQVSPFSFRTLIRVTDQRMDFGWGQGVAAFEKIEFDDKEDAEDASAEPVEEVECRRGGAARGQKIIDEDHGFTLMDAVGVDFKFR